MSIIDQFNRQYHYYDKKQRNRKAEENQQFLKKLKQENMPPSLISYMENSFKNRFIGCRKVSLSCMDSTLRRRHDRIMGLLWRMGRFKEYEARKKRRLLKLAQMKWHRIHSKSLPKWF